MLVLSLLIKLVLRIATRIIINISLMSEYDEIVAWYCLGAKSSFILPPSGSVLRRLLILQDNSVHVKFSTAAFSVCQKIIVHFYYATVSQRMRAFRESEMMK